MSVYYLVSQLPSLDGVGENTPLPITEDRFRDLCSRFLSKESQCEIENLSLVPPIQPQRTKSALIQAWNEGERDLRLALGKARADRMNKPFDMHNRSLTTELNKTAINAVESENPLEAENILLNYRMRFLEILRPTDMFSEDFVFYYALKLKLIERTRRFDKEIGQIVYKNIYNSILNGKNLEA